MNDHAPRINAIRKREEENARMDAAERKYAPWAWLFILGLFGLAMIWRW